MVNAASNSLVTNGFVSDRLIALSEMGYIKIQGGSIVYPCPSEKVPENE